MKKGPYDVILVGGTGFIGSALGQKFSEQGERVLSISRHGETLRDGIEILELDITQKEAVAQHFPQGEHVFILIGQNSAQFNKEQELANLDTLITALNKTLPKKVFYLSSVLVYGETQEAAAETTPCQPVDEYSRFKCAAEALLHEKLDKRITLGILRLANVYGGQKNRGFIGLIMSRLFEKKGEVIIVNGDGLQERDYLFIDDAVGALFALKERLTENDTINIATGVSYSLLDLLRELSRLAQQKLAYEVNGKKLEEVVNSRISIEKLTKKYGYIPGNTFTEGLEKTLKRYETTSEKILPKVLLLGGEGFIGRNLVTFLSREYNCFSVGKKSSIFPGRRDSFLEADPYENAIPNKYQAVIHLIDEKVSADRLLEREERLVKNIGLHKGNQLIIFSSAVVYVNPNSPYGLRKRALEKFYEEFCKKNDIPLTILRPFNLYGPFQIPFRQGSLIANLIYNYLEGKPTEINDMEARRDFMYVEDIARFVAHALKYRLEGTYDLGSGKLTSIRELIRLLEENIFKEEVKIVEKNNPDTLEDHVARGGLLEALSMVGFEEGLVRTLDFYKEHQALLKSCMKENK